MTTMQHGDFELNPVSGLQDTPIHQTLAGYVVTPQPVHCFDDALVSI